MNDDYSYWSENLHSSYLFYTMEVDKLRKENKLLREALEKIVNDCTNKATKCNNCALKKEPCVSYIAKQALGDTCD